MTFLMGMLSISQIDTPYQLQIVQTSLLVIHVGVVIVALIATVVSIVIAIVKIKKINKESKVSVTAIIPLNDEDGERSGAAKSVTKDSMASLSPLKKVREQYGAGSREYQSAMMSIRGIR